MELTVFAYNRETTTTIFPVDSLKVIFFIITNIIIIRLFKNRVNNKHTTMIINPGVVYIMLNVYKLEFLHHNIMHTIYYVYHILLIFTLQPVLPYGGNFD